VCRLAGHDRHGIDDDAPAREQSRGSPGPVFQTSIAIIVLSVPAHYLPIFMR
jgi:hypothetical protein